MIVVLQPGASEAQIDHILDTVREWGMKPHISKGEERTIIGLIGDERVLRERPLTILPGVERVMPVVKPYKLASREFRADRSVVRLPPILDGSPPVEIGGSRVVVVAGPCSVEHRDMLLEMARLVKACGGGLLRAGAFKPRSSPYAFQGLGIEGLRILAEARQEVGLPIVTEVMDTRDVELVGEVADVLQIGARNMQNFSLLKSVGRSSRPVLIKRGLSSTIEELLMSAEYVMSQGNEQVLLCERGIRTFESATRNTMDLSAVPLLKQLSHLPVLADPSHATGRWELVTPMARAAVACGADGIMIEVHPDPEHALSDGPQALLPDTFRRLMQEMREIAAAIGRDVG